MLQSRTRVTTTTAAAAVEAEGFIYDDAYHCNGHKSALFWFLRGTCDKASKLSILGGYSDVLRYVWTLSCEEWWDLHIIRFKPNETITTTEDNDFIPELLNLPYKVLPDHNTYSKLYPKDRQSVAGCPIAILEKNITFPVLLNTENPVYINMMPIDLHDLSHSVPEHCHGYLPLIESCIKCLGGSSNSQISYLTVDERPMRHNATQRREGLHVESPGLLPIAAADTEIEILPPLHERYMHQSGSYVPGAEHHWGKGLMMRNERVVGGIFMASNTANTCAVWNCSICDNLGSTNRNIIGQQGSIEHLRSILGPPTKLLEANELIWMTDKTPHESLPIRSADDKMIYRQYFRLVVGDVTAWFADHSTANPLGIVPPESVRIVHGSKFELYRGISHCWSTGLEHELVVAKEEKKLRLKCIEYGLGHLADRLILHGVASIDALLEIEDAAEHIHLTFADDRTGGWFYEYPQLEQMMTDLRALTDT